MDEIENTEEVESRYEPPAQVEPPSGPVDLTADPKWREKAELAEQINSQYARAERHRRYGDSQMTKVAEGVAKSLERDLQKLYDEHPHPGVKQAIESETTAHERDLAAAHEDKAHFENIRIQHGDEKVLTDTRTRVADVNQYNLGKTPWLWVVPGDSKYNPLKKATRPVPVDAGSIERADSIRRCLQAAGDRTTAWDELQKHRSFIELPEEDSGPSQKEYEKTRPQPKYHSAMGVKWAK
jgi:hypothetical protein